VHQNASSKKKKIDKNGENTSLALRGGGNADLHAGVQCCTTNIYCRDIENAICSEISFISSLNNIFTDKTLGIDKGQY
jgi:phosphoenolpyruvate synthase/pyruvate phosphate dikinase